MAKLTPIITSFGNEANYLSYGISLERLNLKSFRCFGDVEINFDSRLTVFIAENGGGKTTVLDAIAECLKVYLTALKVNGYKTNLIASKDVKFGETYANCSLLVDIDYVSFAESIETPNNALTFLTVTTSEEEQKTQLTSDFYQQAKSLKNTHLHFPVLVYYGGNSVPVDYNDKEKTNLDRVNMVYKGSLSGRRLHFTTFLNWWEKNEYLMFRIKNKTSPKFITLNDQFTKLKRAIEFVLNDDPNDPTYTDLRINEEEELKMGMDKKTHDGTQFVEIKQFSSGEQALFAFVVNLGLRLLHATPLATNIDADNAYRILGKGIVLIDEVDLHLHPKWQQKIIGKLMEVFPDVQFVVTTHSPEALKGINRNHLRIIKNNRIALNLPYIEGRDTNSILEDAFGSYKRFKKDEEKLSNLYTLINTDKEAASKLLAELKEKWGEADSEIIRAESYMEIF